MSSRFHQVIRAVATFALLAMCSQASAQSDDPEMRIQQLENHLRQLTGQNEELQYRNRQLEDRLRMLQSGAQAAPGGQPGVIQPNTVQPNVAAAPRSSLVRPTVSRRMSSSRSPRRLPSCRRLSARRRHRVGDVATHSTQPKTRTLLAPRARSVAVSSRFRPRRRSARPVAVGRASRSISPTPVLRSLPRACRRLRAPR